MSELQSIFMYDCTKKVQRFGQQQQLHQQRQQQQQQQNLCHYYYYHPFHSCYYFLPFYFYYYVTTNISKDWRVSSLSIKVPIHTKKRILPLPQLYTMIRRSTTNWDANVLSKRTFQTPTIPINTIRTTTTSTNTKCYYSSNSLQNSCTCNHSYRSSNCPEELQYKGYQRTTTHRHIPFKSMYDFSLSVRRRAHKTSTISTTTTTTTTTTVPIIHNTKNVPINEEILYQELKDLSSLIRYHDDLYYNNNNNNNSNNDNDNSNLASLDRSRISDEEYDALASREEFLCIQYPHLLRRLEQEHPQLGSKTTRYGGRVGGSVDDTLPETTTTTTTTTTTRKNDNHNHSYNEINHSLDDSGGGCGTDNNNNNNIRPNIPNQTYRDMQPQRRRKHLQPMLSLENVHTTEQTIAWVNRIVTKVLLRLHQLNDQSSLSNNNTNNIPVADAYRTTPPTLSNNTNTTITIATEPKLDGISLSLRYRRCRPLNHSYELEWACTRGDGTEGIDVTTAVRQANLAPININALPLHTTAAAAAAARNDERNKNNPKNRNNQNDNASPLNSFFYPEMFEVRGEVVLPLSEFLDMKQTFHHQQQQQQQQQQPLQMLSKPDLVVSVQQNCSDSSNNSSSSSSSSSYTETSTASTNETSSSSSTPPTVEGSNAPTNGLTFFSNARNAASGILLRKQNQFVFHENRMNEHGNNSNTNDHDPNKDKDTRLNQKNQDESYLLQSKLRFYAYDIIVTTSLDDYNTNATTTNSIVDNSNYLNVRRLLQSWNFNIPEPLAVTKISTQFDDINSFNNSNNDSIEVNNNNNNDNRNTNKLTSNNIPPMLLSQHDIEPMLTYHDQLCQHRIKIQNGISHQHETTISKPSQNIQPTGEVIDDFATTFTATAPTRTGWGDYEMDGCVHKICELNVRNILGSSNRAPRWAVAHKFPPSTAVTTLLNIEVQVGRTGVLTPVAVLHPVNINGVLVQRATLHNFIQMQAIFRKAFDPKSANNKDHFLRSSSASITSNSDITNSINNFGEDDDYDNFEVPVGVQVIVRRAGDVIPQVMSVLPTSLLSTSFLPTSNRGTISLMAPKQCPACGSPVVFNSSPSLHPSRTKSKNNNKNKIGNETETIRDAESPPNNPFTNDYGTEQEFDIHLTGAGDINTVGRIARCSGPSLLCPPRAVGALQHAFSRDALNVRGLSHARISQLMEVGSVRLPADFFDIFNRTNVTENDFDDTRIQTIQNLQGWGTKSIRNLQNEAMRLAVTDGTTLSRFIYSLGIRHVGLNMANILANIYGTVDSFLDDLQMASKTASASIDNDHARNGPNPTDAEFYTTSTFRRLQEENEITKGIGPSVLESLREFAQQTDLLDAAINLAQKIKIHDVRQSNNNEGISSLSTETTSSIETEGSSSSEDESSMFVQSPLKGLRVVFTGPLPPLPSSGEIIHRSEAESYARSILGAHSTPKTVTKQTDVLVVGPTNSFSEPNKRTSTKVLLAQKNGIRIMSGHEYVSLVEQFRRIQNNKSKQK